jgi:hypothetical protein
LLNTMYAPKLPGRRSDWRSWGRWGLLIIISLCIAENGEEGTIPFVPGQGVRRYQLGNNALGGITGHGRKVILQPVECKILYGIGEENCGQARPAGFAGSAQLAKTAECRPAVLEPLHRGVAMVGPSKIAILARAKSCCAQDGKAWDAAAAKRLADPDGKVGHTISDKERALYLATAEMLLRRERAAKPHQGP